MYRIISIVLSALFCGAAAAQSDRLPWVDSEFPPVRGNYRYEVARGEGSSLAGARNDAFNGLLENLGNQAGITVNSQTISEIRSNLNYSAGSQRYDETQASRTTHTIDREGFSAAFIKVGEYYEQKHGRYQLWELYEVSDGRAFEAYVPQYTTHYGFSAGLRSAVVPGWGQFHKKKTAKGVILLTAEVAAVTGIFFCETKRSDNMRMSQETTNMTLIKEYRKRADTREMQRNVLIGAAAGIYLYNVLDAALAKGKPKYRHVSVAPAVLSDRDAVYCGVVIGF